MEERIVLDIDLRELKKALIFGRPLPPIKDPATKHAPGAHDQASHGNWARGYTQGVLFAESELPPVVPLGQPKPGKGGKVKVLVDNYDTDDADDQENVEWTFDHSSAHLFHGLDLEQIVDAVGSAYSTPGLNIEVDIDDLSNEHTLFVVIAGEISQEIEVEQRVRGRRETTLSSTKVGTFKDEIKTVRYDRYGGHELTILHADILFMEEGYQDKGLAKGLAFSKLRLAHSLGLAGVGFEADITIGRYAWAKYGASYADPDRARLVTLKFRAWAAARHGYPEPSTGWPEFKTPYEVATYKHPAGYTLTPPLGFNPHMKSGEELNLGKAFMLDYNNGHGNWDAITWVNKPIWAD